MTPITIRQILVARDAPADRPTKAGWSRALLESWGVPWPAPLFWVEKLAWSGIPYREPTMDDVRVSPFLRAVIWTPTVPAAPQAVTAAPEPAPDAPGSPPERAEPPPPLPDAPPAAAPPSPRVKPKRAAPAPKPKPPQGMLL